MKTSSEMRRRDRKKISKLKRIVRIGASSSSNSINKKFASYAANLVSLKTEVIELDLRQYEMPIYSEDLQNLSGIPKKAFDFKILQSFEILAFLAH